MIIYHDPVEARIKCGPPCCSYTKDLRLRAAVFVKEGDAIYRIFIWVNGVWIPVANCPNCMEPFEIKITTSKEILNAPHL